MHRRSIVAGNWKMNKNLDESVKLATDIAHQEIPNEVDVILSPSFISLHAVSQAVIGSKIKVAAQNCHIKPSGAYTGEVSTQMILSTGAKYVLVGHSERRIYNGESDNTVAEKIKVVLDAGLIPIYCCGEPIGIREEMNHIYYVTNQISTSLKELNTNQLSSIVIAYEPIWAIGTGLTASPDQAQEMHHTIRNRIKQDHGEEVANGIPILYGGSCKPSNAKELFSQEDVDGGLIGGASLNAIDFLAIIQAF